MLIFKSIDVQGSTVKLVRNTVLIILTPTTTRKDNDCHQKCVLRISDSCIRSLYFSLSLFFGSNVVISAIGIVPTKLKFIYIILPLKRIIVFSLLKSKMLLVLQFLSNMYQKSSFYRWEYKLLNIVKHGFYCFLIPLVAYEIQLKIVKCNKLGSSKQQFCFKCLKQTFHRNTNKMHANVI